MLHESHIAWDLFYWVKLAPVHEPNESSRVVQGSRTSSLNKRLLKIEWEEGWDRTTLNQKPIYFYDKYKQFFSYKKIYFKKSGTRFLSLANHSFCIWPWVSRWTNMVRMMSSTFLCPCLLALLLLSFWLMP